MVHLNGDNVVVRVVAAFLRQDLRFFKTTFFHQVVEFFGILGETILHIKLVLTLLTDIFVNVAILSGDRNAGAVSDDEFLRVGDRHIDGIIEVSLQGRVESRFVNLFAELLPGRRASLGEVSRT